MAAPFPTDRWSLLEPLLLAVGACSVALSIVFVDPGSAPSAAQPPPPTAPFEVPGTRSYDWSSHDVVAIVHRHLVEVGADADAATAAALTWPPPDHPEADGYANPPPIGDWTPGGWLVETAVGRWWVIQAYGRVSAADDVARALEIRAPGRTDLISP